MTTSRSNRHFAWSLPLSGTIHLFILAFGIAFALRHHGCALMGDRGDDGERGHSGSGGTTLDFSLAAPPVAERIARPLAPPPAAEHAAAPSHAPPEPEPTPPEHHDDGVVIAQARPPRDPARTHARPRPQSSSSPAPTDIATHAAQPSPETESPIHPGGGTGASTTDNGLRPGSVGSQRALLPRAVTCGDPVAGVWRAIKYDPNYGDWMLATLRIRRGEGDALVGTITSHGWEGGAWDSRPPPCGFFGFEYIVDMPGTGSVHGEEVAFGASSWRLREMRCNPTMRLLEYQPDHFTGTIDTRLQEFQSVNNDGARAINDPMVFRRIGCITDAASGAPAASTASAPGADAASGMPSSAPSGRP